MSDAGITPTNEATRPCPMCGDGLATESLVMQEFDYGADSDSVVLSATVPLWTCHNCGEEFTDYRAEIIRHDAVCDHLGRLRPAELRALRERHNVTQDQFSQVTGIGVASIKRWESGNLIQGTAMDRYLRLLHNSTDFERLRKKVATPRKRTEPIFRTKITDDMRLKAARFQLRPTARRMAA